MGFGFRSPHPPDAAATWTHLSCLCCALSPPIPCVVWMSLSGCTKLETELALLKFPGVLGSWTQCAGQALESGRRAGAQSRCSRGRSRCRQATQLAGHGGRCAVPCGLRWEGEGMAPVGDPFSLRQSSPSAS